MSKAFVKEAEDALDEEELGQEPRPEGKNYITPAGFARLKQELLNLLDLERPEVVRTVAWAASNGDRSENGDYIYGKRRLREIDRRIRFLNSRLDSAEVVDPAAQSSDRVHFGASVTVSDEAGAEHRYRIVGVDEIDLKRGMVSWKSPIARALFNARAGEVVSLEAPGGIRELEVIEVRYEPIA